MLLESPDSKPQLLPTGSQMSSWKEGFFHQMIVSFLFLTLFARVKVFEVQALIRSASPNPSSLRRQASLMEVMLRLRCLLRL